MKKIIGGLMGVFAVAAVVGGSAFALFTSQATVNGINLNTGTAGLLIAAGTATPTQSNITLNVTDTLIPGENPPAQQFTLLNNSNEVDFNITAKLTSAGGDWGTLNSLITATVEFDTNGVDGIETGESVSGTLANWNAGEVPLPGGVLSDGQSRTYTVKYSLDPNAGNEAAGKSLTNITFVFTGTQTP